MDRWLATTFGEIVEFFDSRRVPLNSRQRAARPGPYPYYGASGIIDYIDDYLFEGRYLLVAEDGENLNSRKLPVAFFAKGRFWVNNHAHIIRARDGFADDEFLKHWFAGNSISGYVTGAAQPKLSQSSLKRISIKLPPYPVQRRIAGILSAYDDLIENNTRRIVILEEMARRIYEEWFVHFRFPGHEGVMIVESEIGPVPGNWELTSLGDLAAEVRNAVHPSTVPPETPHVGLEHIPRRSITLSQWGEPGTVESTKLKFNEGDILFGKIRPYFHKVVVAPFDGICSSDTIVIRPAERRWLPLVLTCTSSDRFVDHSSQTSQGTKMPRANWNVLARYPLPTPPAQVLQAFNQFVDLIIDQTRNLMLKNANLRTQRDFLLPKLISGEIDVSEVGETLTEAAAE